MEFGSIGPLKIIGIVGHPLMPFSLTAQWRPLGDGDGTDALVLEAKQEVSIWHRSSLPSDRILNEYTDDIERSMRGYLYPSRFRKLDGYRLIAE
jgi:hypothetical protein